MAQHSFQNGERQPLLQAYETQSRKWPLADKHIRELATFFNLWWPLWLTQLLDVSMIVANVISVGHLGALQLASVQLSTATAGALGRGTLFGLNSGMDTLLTQGWTSSHPQQIGLHAQRQAVIVAIMVVLQLLLFHNAEPILLALHQNADVAHLTSKCLKIQSLFLPFMGMSDIAARWLAAQGRVGVATCVLAVTAPLGITLNYFLVWHTRLGVFGSPVAIVCAEAFNFTCLYTYIILCIPKTGWPGLTLKAFANLGANLRFGFPAMIAVFCEWGAFDVFQFLAGAIGDLQLATMSVVFTVQFFLFQAAFSMGQASTVRIGNLLGANQPLQARVTLRVLFLCSSAVALACLAVLLPSGEFIGRMMTSDEAVVKEFKCILPWLCASQVADIYQGAFLGPFRATGRPSLAAATMIISFWLFGIPLGWVLAFAKHQGLPGLYQGFLAGLATSAAVEVGLGAFWIDYEQEAVNAQKRNNKAAQELHGETVAAI